MILSTGLLTAIWATVDLILYLVIPDGRCVSILLCIIALVHESNDSCLILYIPIPKLYSNSIMASLNARRGFKARLAREPLREVRSFTLSFDITLIKPSQTEGGGFPIFHPNLEVSSSTICVSFLSGANTPSRTFLCRGIWTLSHRCRLCGLSGILCAFVNTNGGWYGFHSSGVLEDEAIWG